MTRAKRRLAGATLAELAERLGSRRRALAAVRWLHATRPLPASMPERIEGVAPEAWSRAREAFGHDLPRVVARSVSGDGTAKVAFEGAGACPEQGRGARYEAVLIPGRGRSTVCVSSQSGCTRRCAFCATARLPFARNLDASEMVGQYLLARQEAPPGAPVRNVVFMGMGEPLDNLDEVLRAVEVLTQAPAPQLGAGHVTVSTSGVLPQMRRFLEHCPAHLALSLNGTTQEQRAELMPQARRWPLDELLGLLRQSSRESERLFFIEYVLLDGFNDSDEDARRLAALLAGIRARVNLIPLNGFEGCRYRPSPKARALAFQAIVHRSGIRCLLRSSRGGEIGAACGQLALVSP